MSATHRVTRVTPVNYNIAHLDVGPHSVRLTLNDLLTLWEQIHDAVLIMGSMEIPETEF